MFRIVSFTFLVVSLVLSGCNTFNVLRDDKLAKTFYAGADKFSVERDLGQPKSSIKTLNGKGICYNYDHTLPDGSVTPLYVGFRKTDNKVVSFGMLTCEVASSKGYLNNDEPIKQVY
jgi:osmotically inducible lipoprotein OsmE